MDAVLPPNLYDAAALCLAAHEPRDKLALTAAAADAWRRGALSRTGGAPVRAIDVPGRPARPTLVSPRQVPQRGLGTPEGRAALVHAIAHIEFNAINLAWDAVYRFRAMPDAYYADWIGVAADEARHYALLAQRLAELGHAYGDFDAHDGLWEMARLTAGACLERMALVPRVLEARGLDVTPGMIARLRSVGDARTVEILELILREEVAHVAAGTRWYLHCCALERCDPQVTFDALVERHCRNAIKGPFNMDARRAAGFTPDELARLEARVA